MDIRNSLLQLVPLAILISSSATVQSTSHVNGVPTCENYILNTYLFLTIALSLVVTLTLFMNVIMPNYTDLLLSRLVILIIVIITHIVLMFYLRYLINTISPLEIKKKLATWLLYIINLTLFLLPSLQIMIRHKMGGLIVSTMLITLCITLSLSAIAFAKPELINTTQWKPYLFVALVILLLGYLVPIFSCLAGVCNNAFLNSWGYYIAILAVIIFSFVLLYHTKEVIQNAEKCKKPEDADYMKESTNLFMAIINIFFNLLSGRRKSRR
jgi:FtsH-binding integral membrane protein